MSKDKDFQISHWKQCKREDRIIFKYRKKRKKNLLPKDTIFCENIFSKIKVK